MYSVQGARLSRFLLTIDRLESDIPLTAVSTPIGMFYKWLVMPQGLLNAPATFNGPVAQLFRPHRGYAQPYFDGIFVRSRAMNGRQMGMIMLTC